MPRLVDVPIAFSGSVHRPGDDGYSVATRLWNLRGADQTPALIAQVADVDDVVRAVHWAVEQDLQIAVCGGGHGVDASAMASDALVIDTSGLKAISIDPHNRRVTIGAGVLLGEMDAATQAYGLVVPAGTVTDTGAVGLTLGGGIGHLARRFGATVDHLISVDVVTTDGRVLTASATENPELFWGMRGAGHNLAIATSCTYQAEQVGPEVMSGLLFYGAEDAVRLLAGIDDALTRSPRALSIAMVMLAAPPVPGIPDEMIGSPALLAIVVYTGPLDDYPAAMAEINALATPLTGGVGPSLWVEANAIVDAFNPRGRRYHSAGGYVPAFSAELAQVLMDRIRSAPRPTGPTTACTFAFPMLGGALAEVDEDATAFSRLGASWLAEVIGMWEDPAADAEYMRWVDESLTALAPYLGAAGYVNLTADRGADWLRGVYGAPEKWGRIVALKREWDPDNRLSHNKNVMRAIATGAVS